MSNDELTKHAIRTSADMLELNEKFDDVIRTQNEHSDRFEHIDGRFDEVDKRFDRVEERLDRVESRLDAHISRSEDHFRKTDANFLEIRDLLAQLLQRSG
jgi:predicted nuclease with TOPRIM domain